MAFRSIYFPSSTTGYNTPIGSIRIRFYYYYTSELTVNDDAALLDIKPIEIPLESGPSEQSYRFDSVKLTFAYSSIFDNAAVMHHAPNATWCDIYIDGAIYWKGVVNFDKMKKYDWIINTSGTLQWQKVDIEVFGCFAFFWWNDTTLADCGYTIGDDLESTLIAICDYLDIDSADVVVDANIKIAVDYGATEYDAGDIQLNIAGLTKVRDFLKPLIIELGLFIFYLDGKAYFVLRNGGATVSITNTDIITVEKGINDNIIEYVKITCEKEVGDFTGEFAHPDDGELVKIKTFDAEFTHGIESPDEFRNFVIYECTLLQNLYTIATGAANYPTSFSANTAIKAGSVDGTMVADPTYIDFETNLIEDGDIIYFNGGYSVNPFEEGSMVYEVTDDHTVKYFATGVAPDVDDAFTIYRGAPGETEKQSGVSRLRYKFYKLAEMAAGVYEDYFLTSRDIIKITLYDVSAFDDLSKRFVFASENYRARSARVDLLKDTIYLELIKVT